MKKLFGMISVLLAVLLSSASGEQEANATKPQEVQQPSFESSSESAETERSNTTSPSVAVKVEVDPKTSNGGRRNLAHRNFPWQESLGWYYQQQHDYQNQQQGGYYQGQYGGTNQNPGGGQYPGSGQNPLPNQYPWPNQYPGANPNQWSGQQYPASRPPFGFSPQYPNGNPYLGSNNGIPNQYPNPNVYSGSQLPNVQQQPPLSAGQGDCYPGEIYAGCRCSWSQNGAVGCPRGAYCRYNGACCSSKIP